MGRGVSARFERRERISSKTCSGAGRRPVSTVCTRCGGKSLWITEPVGHTSTQCPQPIQRSVRTASIPFLSVLRTMIPAGHTCTHFPQAMQLLFSIRRVITSMSAEGFVGGDGLSERCQPAATHRTLRAAAPVAVFGGQLQQCLRLEGVGRTQIVETPAAHEAVLLGGNGFEQREGPARAAARCRCRHRRRTGSGRRG